MFALGRVCNFVVPGLEGKCRDNGLKLATTTSSFINCIILLAVIPSFDVGTSAPISWASLDGGALQQTLAPPAIAVQGYWNLRRGLEQ
jgi:hypothetical protein